MNSKQLQNLHNTNYDKFFQQHEFVLSCPFIVNWCGDVLKNYSGIRIPQKIPLRMYIGISSTSSCEIEIGDIDYFDSGLGQFYKQPLSSYSSYITRVFEAIRIRFQNTGLRIDILTECSQSLGLGFTSILTIALITGIKLFKKEISIKELDSIKSDFIGNSFEDENGIIQNIFEESIAIDISILNKSGYSSKLCTFFNGTYPFVGFRGSYLKDQTQLSEGRINRKIYGYRLNDLRSDIGDSNYFPYDYSILYSGNPFMIENINDSHLNKIPFRSAKDELLKKFKPLCGMNKNKPKFYTNLLEQQNESINDIYGKMIGSISLEVLFLMKEILGNDYYEGRLNEFLYCLNKFKLSNSLTRINSEEFIKFLKQLEKHLDTGDNQIALLPNDSTITGGCVNVVSPLESCRKKVMEFTTTYKNKSNDNNAYLIYSNRIDGYEKEGIKLEQDISEKVVSIFCKGSCYNIINRNKTISLKTYQGGISDTINDIILDLTKNKIFIGGEICKTIDLHSQTTTIEVLLGIINNNGLSISNKELSSSSYTKNKNEMVTKILKPLIIIIEKKLKKNIKLKCHGSGSSYIIEADLDNIKIGILNEI